MILERCRKPLPESSILARGPDTFDGRCREYVEGETTWLLDLIEVSFVAIRLQMLGCRTCDVRWEVHILGRSRVFAVSHGETRSAHFGFLEPLSPKRKLSPTMRLDIVLYHLCSFCFYRTAALRILSLIKKIRMSQVTMKYVLSCYVSYMFYHTFNQR